MCSKGDLIVCSLSWSMGEFFNRDQILNKFGGKFFTSKGKEQR